MLCTAALGMVMDVPNVDVVVNIECPPFLEEMVQEFGIAGRDDCKANDVLIRPMDKCWFRKSGSDYRRRYIACYIYILATVLQCCITEIQGFCHSVN